MTDTQFYSIIQIILGVMLVLILISVPPRLWSLSTIFIVVFAILYAQSAKNNERRRPK